MDGPAGVVASSSAPLLPREAIAMVVGIVIGAAIFETPSLVAGSLRSPGLILLAWVAGGAISLLGALCYAELASNYPDPGGDYAYLTRAFGSATGFLFVWARVAVIQTGSIAMIAFVFGDYASQILPLGANSPAVYAGMAVLALTFLNVIGIHRTAAGQSWLSAVQIAGILLIVVAGVIIGPVGDTAAEPPRSGGVGLGLAMVFILLTYGGWNEAAFLSAELRDGRRTMVWVMVASIAIITAVYLAVNAALLFTLGPAAMSASKAVAADAIRPLLGQKGAVAIALVVAVCALASINAMIFTGARTGYALGRDFPVFRPLGRWNSDRRAPVTAVIVIGMVTLGLVGFGAAQRRGFEAMVEFTAPVFWGFVLMTALSLLVLRRRDRSAGQGFRVPGYPVLPILFIVVCAWLLYSSIAYTKIGALLGLAVVIAGVPLLIMDRRRRALSGAASPSVEAFSLD